MHSTSLTGLIHALILLSLIRQFPSGKAFVGGTPISLRPYVNDPDFDGDTYIHDLATSYGHFFGSSTVLELQDLLHTDRRELKLEDKMWQVAKEVKQELNQKLQMLPADDILGMVHWVSDWRQWTRQKDRKHREWTWEVSNIGVFRDNTGDDAGITVRRQLFSQSAGTAGTVVGVSMAGCNGEKAVAITITWMDGVVSKDVVTSLLGDLDEWTRNLASCGRLRG